MLSNISRAAFQDCGTCPLDLKVIRENPSSQPGETSPPTGIKPVDRLVYIQSLCSQTLGRAERTQMSGYKYVCLLTTQVDRSMHRRLPFYFIYFLTGLVDKTKGTARPMNPKVCFWEPQSFWESVIWLGDEEGKRKLGG